MWECLQLPLHLWPLRREENQGVKDLVGEAGAGSGGCWMREKDASLPPGLVHEGQETMRCLSPTSFLPTDTPSVCPAPLFSEQLGKGLFVGDGQTAHSLIFCQAGLSSERVLARAGRSGTLSPLGVTYWDSTITESLGLTVGDTWGHVVLGPNRSKSQLCQ